MTPQTQQQPLPILQNYQDYRAYLKDFYLYKKAENKNFSFRRFAQLAGIKSSNFLMLVMQGKRALSEETAARVAKAMKLNINEKDYFVSLVKLTESTPEQAQAFEKERRIALKKMLSKAVSKDKAAFYANGIHGIIREFAFLKDFEPNGKWIASKLRNMVTPEEATESLKLLIRLQLLKETNNTLKPTDHVIESGPEDAVFAEDRITLLHKQTLQMWAQMIEDIDRKDRELALLNIPIRSSQVPELKKRIQDFQDELIGWLQDEKNCDEFVQVGTYLVPLTQKK